MENIHRTADAACTRHVHVFDIFFLPSPEVVIYHSSIPSTIVHTAFFSYRPSQQRFKPCTHCTDILSSRSSNISSNRSSRYSGKIDP